MCLICAICASKSPPPHEFRNIPISFFIHSSSLSILISYVPIPSLTPSSSTALFSVSVFISLFFCLLVRLCLPLSCSCSPSWIFQVSTLTLFCIFQIIASKTQFAFYLFLCLSISLCLRSCHSRSLADTLFRIFQIATLSFSRIFPYHCYLLICFSLNCSGPSSLSPLYSL